MLTFKDIREQCKPGEHLLVDKCGNGYLYFGFTRNNLRLITDFHNMSHACVWYEYEIKELRIEPYEAPKPKRKATLWRHWYEVRNNIYYAETAQSWSERHEPNKDVKHIKSTIIEEFEV